MRAAAILLAALCACGGRGELEHERTEPPDEPAPAKHDDDAQLVRIAPEMIRDLRVTTAVAESRAAGERASVLAELRVNQDAYAEVASPSQARVARVLARAGDEVVRDQPLVELASGDLAKARAELQAADARLALARQALERKERLHADRLVAEREVIEARAAVTEAEAARTVALGTLAPFAGAAAAGGLTLRAPIAGTVIDRDVVLGQLVDPSKTLFKIGDLRMLWLVAHVFERDAVRVQVGATGTATFAALPGKTVMGKITWVGRVVETASRTVPVRLEVANVDGTLRPGMSATVSLPVGEPGGRVVAVPIAAVQRLEDRWCVFLARSAGTYEVRPVGRGRDLGGEVEIVSGLRAGEEVVVDGAFLLKAEVEKSREEGGHEHHH
ncbi:MAG: efflux RND transporter periplasmic adaptor subunit [Deltaproteobacteria bacterium]|nr:efflux RND transporter periplasmic adaptor subunit [Deltaproteobacteria bacterium]